MLRRRRSSRHFDNRIILADSTVFAELINCSLRRSDQEVDQSSRRVYGKRRNDREFYKAVRRLIEICFGRRAILAVVIMSPEAKSFAA